LGVLEEEAASLFEVFGERGLNQVDVARVVLNTTVRNKVVRKNIAFVVSGGPHGITLILNPRILMIGQILPPEQAIAHGAADD